MKTKLHLTCLIILTSLSMNVFSQGLSSMVNPGPAQTNAAPDFEKTKGEMISFHMLKVVDHQKVVDCLKKTTDFESMNGCNKILEKYLKKNVEKEKEQKEQAEPEAQQE
jgi:hypothetical protein